MHNTSLSTYIEKVRAEKKIGLMTHVVVGFPSIPATKKIIRQMVVSGVDCIELQIPFSDPLADGPVIMQANDRALENGVTLEDCLKVMSEMSHETQIPLFFMCYYQTIFHRGVERFCQEAGAAGAKGIIVPDLPIDEEEYQHFLDCCQAAGMDHIRVLSPTATLERIALNAQFHNELVYCTARVGITGKQTSLSEDSKKFIYEVKNYVQCPIAVGFGIKSRDQVRALIGYADIAVIGSAVIEQITKNGVESVKGFLEQFQNM
jgi:tryptophan synthase alpha chain